MSEAEMLRRIIGAARFYCTANEIAERAELPSTLTPSRLTGLLRKLTTVGLMNANALESPVRYGLSRSGEFVKRQMGVVQ